MNIRILAIDDSATMRALLAQALGNGDFTVTLAEDGVEGLEKLDATDPHLVITDINMPRLDGFGVIEGIRGSPGHQALPVLVLTTESSSDMKDRARRAGATGWIIKPFDDLALIGLIRRVLGI